MKLSRTSPSFVPAFRIPSRLSLSIVKGIAHITWVHKLESVAGSSSSSQFCRTFKPSVPARFFFARSIIMSTSDFPLNIRHANPEDFEIIGKLHASAMADEPLENFLCAAVDPNISRHQMWLDTAVPRVTKGQDTMLILERSDTKEIIGLAWFRKIKEDRKSELGVPGLSPQGFNIEAKKKLSAGRIEWQKKLSEDFGEYICEYLWPACQFINHLDHHSDHKILPQGFENSTSHQLTSLKDLAECC